MKAIFISIILLLINGVVSAQNLSFFENPFKIDKIDCLPIHISELDVTDISDTCSGGIYVKGEYKNGEIHKVLANQGEYLYILNYEDGKHDGQQIVVQQDSLELMILHYDSGVEQGWSIMMSKDILPNSSKFYFDISIDDTIVTNIDYNKDGVPLSHKLFYYNFTYEVLFYRTGMPASYVIQKGGECIYAASYYETGLIWKENEGKILSNVGCGNWEIGIHSYQLSDLRNLVKGRHAEYDRHGNLVVEKFVR